MPDRLRRCPFARRSTPIFAAVLSALALLCGQALAGQEPGAEEVDPGPASVLERLEAGQRLRVELAEGRREEGRLRRFVGDSLTIDDGAAVTVSVGGVADLWTRGHSVTTGALIGGGVGLVLGAVAGAWLGDFACAEGGENCTFEAALAVGGIGAVGGAGLGALTGLAIPRWERRWP